MNTLDLQIVTMDLTGEFSPKRFYVATYPHAHILHADGRQEHRTVGFDKEMLAKLKTGGDLTSVTVEIEISDNSTISHVRQVFLPGQDVVPTRVGPANESGEVSFLRRLDDQVELGRTSSDYNGQGFRLSGSDLSITIDGGDCENRIHFDPALLDDMIDGLTMLRALRRGEAPAAGVAAPAAPSNADNLLSDVIDFVAQSDPKLALDALTASSHGAHWRNAGDLAADACHIDADGKQLKPNLGWIAGEGDEAIVVFVYPDRTVTAKVVGSETKLVHCPNVVMGSTHYVADPTFDTLRITGRFDEIDDYDHPGLKEALVRERLIPDNMPTAAFDRWLRLHGANERLLSTYYLDEKDRQRAA